MRYTALVMINKKKILIVIIGIIIILFGYFGLAMYHFARGLQSNADNGNLDAKLYELEKSFDYPSSDKVEFIIEVRKVYYYNKPIEIKLIWKNNSNQSEKIMIKDYLGYPIGTGVSILDSNNTELTSAPSKHILSSQIFTSEELKEYEINLQPNETKEYSVDLLKTPILKENDFTLKKNILPKGKYKIRAFYYLRMSNSIEIEII